MLPIGIPFSSGCNYPHNGLGVCEDLQGRSTDFAERPFCLRGVANGKSNGSLVPPIIVHSELPKELPSGQVFRKSFNFTPEAMQLVLREWEHP